MQNSKQLHFKRKEPKTKDKYMKNKNFGKLKYVPENPENAGFCNIQVFTATEFPYFTRIFD